jgi:hypothetical protein
MFINVHSTTLQGTVQWVCNYLLKPPRGIQGREDRPKSSGSQGRVDDSVIDLNTTGTRCPPNFALADTLHCHRRHDSCSVEQNKHALRRNSNGR